MTRDLAYVFSEQKQVHFQLRNRQSRLVMSLAGDLEDIKIMRIQEIEENGELEQIWFYRNGYLHSKVTTNAKKKKKKKKDSIKDERGKKHYF